MEQVEAYNRTTVRCVSIGWSYGTATGGWTAPTPTTPASLTPTSPCITLRAPPEAASLDALHGSAIRRGSSSCGSSCRSRGERGRSATTIALRLPQLGWHASVLKLLQLQVWATAALGGSRLHVRLEQGPHLQCETGQWGGGGNDRRRSAARCGAVRCGAGLPRAPGGDGGTSRTARSHTRPLGKAACPRNQRARRLAQGSHPGLAESWHPNPAHQEPMEPAVWEVREGGAAAASAKVVAAGVRAAVPGGQTRASVVARRQTWAVPREEAGSAGDR
eukprot:scaffold41210_cov66-Phaeocystis_antarctica.AAC.18